MNVPVVSHLKLLVNLYNKMNNRFWVLLVIYLIIYLLSVLYKNKQIFCAILQVAPIVGAWIEILKDFYEFYRPLVAPIVGAWIEIKSMELKPTTMMVAPIVGAWIEIQTLWT